MKRAIQSIYAIWSRTPARTVGIALTCVLLCGSLAVPAQAREVIAYWGFLEDYEFDEGTTKMDFAADVDATLTGDANLQAYLGDTENFDLNGGSGFEYTSPISGISYEATRTVKWDDVRGGGDDFDIDGVVDFMIDKDDGMGPVTDQFGNDGLLYFQFNLTGWQDLEVRFDIEGTPDSLPETFDIFYRLGGDDTWYRKADRNNIPLTFMDYDPPDEENQFATTGQLSLTSDLNNQAFVELIFSDFGENGNDEMEIDNIEFSANPVPEPSTLWLVGLALTTWALGKRRR